MRALRAALLATAFGLGIACSSDPPANPVPCVRGFLGNASKPVEFDLLVVNAAYDATSLRDGDTVPMLVPLQGGQVIFVGVRATNVDSCGVELTAALRDETSKQVRFDRRPINLIPTSGGWGVTGPIGMSVSGTVSNFANIPVCPNQWATTDLNGHEYGLEVTIKDRSGRTLQKTIHVTPTCGDAAFLSDCLCTCRKDYAPQVTCPPGDGGGDSGDDIGGDSP